MRVLEEIRFDDSDLAPEGVCYIGVDRRVGESGEQFYVRSYDDEPRTAIVMQPEEALNSIYARALVDFLVREFGYEQFEFPFSKTVSFEEIDQSSMRFRNTDDLSKPLRRTDEQ